MKPSAFLNLVGSLSSQLHDSYIVSQEISYCTHSLFTFAIKIIHSLVESHCSKPRSPSTSRSLSQLDVEHSIPQAGLHLTWLAAVTMGNIQSVPVDSYLDRHHCSGRNITWQYIANNGTLVAPYSTCPYASAILSSHCCARGQCTPNWLDREFERYGYDNWDGLGDPYNKTTNTTVGNWTDRSEGKLAMCLGMELWSTENHWPPLGVDGKPVQNFSATSWRNGQRIGDRDGTDYRSRATVLALRTVPQISTLVLVRRDETEMIPTPTGTSTSTPSESSDNRAWIGVASGFSLLVVATAIIIVCLVRDFFFGVRGLGHWCFLVKHRQNCSERELT